MIYNIILYMFTIYKFTILLIEEIKAKDSHEINERLSLPLAEKVVKEMLQAYKDYIPVAIGKIKL